MGMRLFTIVKKRVAHDGLFLVFMRRGGCCVGKRKRDKCNGHVY